jgi:DNA-directed RNA polymerase specialized sigma24 family protein
MIRLAQGQGPEAKAAVQQLIRRFEGYIMAVIRNRRFPPDQKPEDIKQEFLTRMFERNDLAALNESSGTFRGWLSTALERYRCNAWDAWSAQRNPDKHTQLSDQVEVLQSALVQTPEQLCLQQYSLDVLEHVMSCLRAECSDGRRFDTLSRFLPKRQMDPQDYAAAAASLGMPRGTFGKAVHDLRSRFNEVLRSAVADTLDVSLADPAASAEIEREIQFLWSVFDKAGPQA